MKSYLITALIVCIFTAGFFMVLDFVHRTEQKWCEIKFDASTATVPCEEINKRVYGVKL